ncbi:alcohol oxidase [Mycena maculata]|uniref:Alcohol oxidase n=1 Tax=Mycena maculata TaxID=230809 RepID=A0AAD7I907_9AGAR|nr:alcohol oxidase [Mycena maculata]
MFAAFVFTAATLLPHIAIVAVARETTPLLFAGLDFDFIVVGGGTSGLVAAARLTEDPNIVVGVIEAGQYRPNDPVIEIPQSYAAPGVDPGLDGKPVAYPRGKVVGGSSAINSLIWQRGDKDEYDLWATSFGNGPDWSFSSLLPYFKKVETWSPPPVSPATISSNLSSALRSSHGDNGPVHISYNNFLTDVDKPSVEAASIFGVPDNFSPDLGDPLGFSSIARNVDPVKGIRMYASNSYYTPNSNRQNLILLTGAQVTKLMFGDKTLTAIGVEYTAENETYTAHVSKEVILAAGPGLENLKSYSNLIRVLGSLKTPQILELSGVGNKTLLSHLNIPCLVDLPAVGENLQDHPVTVSDFQLTSSTVTLDDLIFNTTFRLQEQALYNASRQGALTYTPAAMAPTTLQTLFGQQDTEQLITSLITSLALMSQTPLQQVQYEAQVELLKAGSIPFLELVVYPTGGVASEPAPNVSYVTIAVMEVHPFGRGSVHINTSNPLANPVIDPRYLEVPFDAQILIKAAQFAQKWMLTEPMSALVESLSTPSSAVTSAAAWDSFVRAHVQSTNHPLGTTAMAPRSIGGVVDPMLKVYGLNNVRVIDAGIFPFTIGVPLQPTVYAVAEKASDMIKQSWDIKY